MAMILVMKYRSITYICDSCNIGMSDLPDMYAQSPRAEGIHITRAYVTTNM